MEKHYTETDRLAELIAKQSIRGSREWAEQQISLGGRRRESISLRRINLLLGVNGFPLVKR